MRSCDDLRREARTLFPGQGRELRQATLDRSDVGGLGKLREFSSIVSLKNIHSVAMIETLPMRSPGPEYVSSDGCFAGHRSRASKVRQGSATLRSGLSRLEALRDHPRGVHHEARINSTSRRGTCTAAIDYGSRFTTIGHPTATGELPQPDKDPPVDVAVGRSRNFRVATNSRYHKNQGHRLGDAANNASKASRSPNQQIQNIAAFRTRACEETRGLFSASA